jgi:hypothetical protein
MEVRELGVMTPQELCPWRSNCDAGANSRRFVYWTPRAGKGASSCCKAAWSAGPLIFSGSISAIAVPCHTCWAVDRSNASTTTSPTVIDFGWFSLPPLVVVGCALSSLALPDEMRTRKSAFCPASAYPLRTSSAATSSCTRRSTSNDRADTWYGEGGASLSRNPKVRKAAKLVTAALVA